MTALAPDDFEHSLKAFTDALSDRRPLGVAVSGGSDSLGLLFGLAEHLPAPRLVALSVDHGLRAGSADEVRRVKALCRCLGIRHETLRWQGEQPQSGLQAAARAARYRLLGEACRRNGLSGIVTAHTLDDQAETLAMRRARSSSDDAPGLAGIPQASLFDGHMWVMRPVLSVRRAVIRRFLESRGVAWIEDPSNEDHRFERVRVRAELRGQSPCETSRQSDAIAASRHLISVRAAAYIGAKGHHEPGGLVHLRCRNDVDVEPEVLARVIEALIDVIGGAERPLDRRGKATLAELTGGRAARDDVAGKAVTLGRTVLRPDAEGLLIGRERRGIDALVLDPGAQSVWDGRFRIRNLDGHSRLAVKASQTSANLPLFTRPGAALHSGWSFDQGVVGGFDCSPLIGRASRILPLSEWPLGQALARLVGARALPACPWQP